MQAYSTSMVSFSASINHLRSQFGLPQMMSGGSTWSSIAPVPAKVTPGRKGIKQTLGYPGPPANPIEKHRKGDRVRDSKGQIWQCTKGGKPGRWDAEESAN
jgi:hypothetical protein